MGKDFLSGFSINNFREGLMNVRACSFLIFGRWHITVFACLQLKFNLEMT